MEVPKNPYAPPAAAGDGDAAGHAGIARLVAMRLAATASAALCALLAVSLLLGVMGSAGLINPVGLVIHCALIGLTGRAAQWFWGRATLSRAQALARDLRASRMRIKAVIAAPELATVPDVESAEYEEHSDEELLEILDRIDPARAGKRFHALISELRRRARTHGADAG